MRSVFFISTLGSLASGFALPNFPVKGHEWIPATPEDSRSPCPGLNILANHGYLPRSGKNIDLPTIQNGVAAAYNYEPTTFDDVFSMVQADQISTTGNSSTFNLEDLVKHGYLEFDGSLSRNDFYFGDALHFDPNIWATMSERMALNKVSSDPTSKYVTVETAAKARAARVADAMKVNPTFNASALEQNGSPGTTALWLTTLWDDSVGGAPKEWIKLFFELERLPYTKPKTQKTAVDIGNMLAKVQAVQV